MNERLIDSTLGVCRVFAARLSCWVTLHEPNLCCESTCVAARRETLRLIRQPSFSSYITPSKRDTEPSEKQFRHIVWLWERCIDLMGPGVDGAVVLLNCACAVSLPKCLDFETYSSCLSSVAGKSKRPSVTLSTRVSSFKSV